MSVAVKEDNNIFRETGTALWVEFQKVKRSKTLWVTAIAFVFIALICGLFMYILRDPEQARSLGLLGAKAEIFGGSADWPNLFNLTLVITSIGGLVIFGFIFVWIFGREFGERTVYDMLALPISRFTIVTAKVIIALIWSVVLILFLFVLVLGVGVALALPGGSAALILNGLKQVVISGLMAAVLCIPFSLVASFTRGYLPAIGFIFIVLALTNLLNTLGYTEFFPWAVPLLYSGAAQVLTGKPADPLGPVSYILAAVVVIISAIAMGMWWRYADQT